MAKRELSSTLKNLKFMQRAAQREEKAKKEEEEVIPDENFPSSSTVRKCIVIVEGDPHPGLTKGRMSFQSFNPSIDKLNEEASSPRQPEDSATCSGNQNARYSDRDDESTQDGSQNLKLNHSNNTSNGELKRKEPEVASETPHPNRSQKKAQDGQEAKKDSRHSHKQAKRDKLDWAVLRPPKGRKKSE